MFCDHADGLVDSAVTTPDQLGLFHLTLGMPVSLGSLLSLPEIRTANGLPLAFQKKYEAGERMHVAGGPTGAC